MEKLSSGFQDWLLMEAIETINSVRPILQSIAECYELDEDGYMVLKVDADLDGAVTHNINPVEESLHLEDFAKRFHQEQYSRIEKRYGKLDLDSYMAKKAEIYQTH